MSSVSSSNATSRCSIHIAKTKDEVEACYDIRMEGELLNSAFFLGMLKVKCQYSLSSRSANLPPFDQPSSNIERIGFPGRHGNRRVRPRSILPQLMKDPSYDPISTHFFLNVPITDPPPESTSFITLPSVTSSSTLKPVGTVRWTPSKAKVSRLALLPAARKQGYGRQLLEAVHRHAEETASTEEMRSVSERSGEKSVKLNLHSQGSYLSLRLRSQSNRGLDICHSFLRKDGLRGRRS